MSKNFYEIFEELNNLDEMALSRKDAINRAMDLQLRFIEHFDKIYNDINCDTINHWASEMQAWLDQVLGIILTYNNKPLNKKQLKDWFFTLVPIAKDCLKRIKQRALYMMTL